MTTIRRAENKDVPGIMNLLTQVLKIHHEGRPDIFKSEGQKYTVKELEGIIADDTKPIFVCVDDDDKVLGHCFLQIFERKESPNIYEYKTIYIDDLCIDENARGRHVGTNLYNYVKEYAKSIGCHNITLHAWECNPNAIAFYNALGMKIQQYTMEEIL